MQYQPKKIIFYSNTILFLKKSQEISPKNIIGKIHKYILLYCVYRVV